MSPDLDRFPLPAAVLFDLDGTLVDTVQTRIAAWLKALEEAGLPTSREQLAPLIGLDGKRLAKEVAAVAGSPIDEARAEEIDHRSGELYEQLNRSPRPLPGVRRLVEAIEARHQLGDCDIESQGASCHVRRGARSGRRADDRRRQPRQARQARAGPPAPRRP